MRRAFLDLCVKIYDASPSWRTLKSDWIYKEIPNDVTGIGLNRFVTGYAPFFYYLAPNLRVGVRRARVPARVRARAHARARARACVRIRARACERAIARVHTIAHARVSVHTRRVRLCARAHARV